MKQLKLSWLLLLSITFFTLLSCQKDLSNTPELTSNAKPVKPPTDDKAVFVLRLPDADITCETNSTYCFPTSLRNPGGELVGGNISISAVILKWNVLTSSYDLVSTSETLTESEGQVCFSNQTLSPGIYRVEVTYEHGNGGADPQDGTFAFPLTVQASADCGTTTCETVGLSFSRTAVLELNESLNAVKVDVTYTVTNCSEQTFNNLKIQGGLVNKAGEPLRSQGGTATFNSDFVAKRNGGNYILTSYFNLAPGEYADFRVIYTVSTACGNYLTGEWSVKNGPVPIISTDLATNDPYYINRLQSVCP